MNENKKDNNKQEPIETTATPTDLTEEEAKVLDQMDEENVNNENVNNENTTQEESVMNENTQVQNNAQAQTTPEPTKKSKVIAVFKGIAKYGTIVAAAGTIGWFGHKYVSERDSSSEPSATDAFI